MAKSTGESGNFLNKDGVVEKSPDHGLLIRASRTLNELGVVLDIHCNVNSKRVGASFYSSIYSHHQTQCIALNGKSIYH